MAVWCCLSLLPQSNRAPLAPTTASAVLLRYENGMSRARSNSSVGAALHYSLERLQPIDLTLDRLAPAFRRRVPHRRKVVAYRPRKALYRLQATSVRFVQPLIELVELTTSQDPSKSHRSRDVAVKLGDDSFKAETSRAPTRRRPPPEDARSAQRRH